MLSDQPVSACLGDFPALKPPIGCKTDHTDGFNNEHPCMLKTGSRNVGDECSRYRRNHHDCTATSIGPAKHRFLAGRKRAPLPIGAWIARKFQRGGATEKADISQAEKKHQCTDIVNRGDMLLPRQLVKERL